MDIIYIYFFGSIAVFLVCYLFYFVYQRKHSDEECHHKSEETHT